MTFKLRCYGENSKHRNLTRISNTADKTSLFIILVPKESGRAKTPNF